MHSVKRQGGTRTGEGRAWLRSLALTAWASRALPYPTGQVRLDKPKNAPIQLSVMYDELTDKASTAYSGTGFADDDGHPPLLGFGLQQ